MEKIKIGYLPLYIKLYDDSDPSKRNPMVQYMNTLVSMLETQGLEITLVEPCRVREEFEKAVEVLKKERVVAVVTQHLAYSPSLESIDALLTLEVPIIVLDTTPDYSLLDTAGYKRGISDNHGIHGVQDMCNLLNRNNREYYLCAGHAMHSPVISEVVGYCRSAKAAYTYRHARIGSVGGSFSGMGDFMISDEKYKNEIGAQVINMAPDDAAKYLTEITDQEVEDEIIKDTRLFTLEVKNRENYVQTIKTGLAVRKWAEDQKLSAFTINFLTLDASGLPKMPFAECSKALGRGLGYAGEGDVLTAGLVGALRGVYYNTTFVEIFCPDWKNDIVLLSHMGEMNYDLAQWKPVLRDVLFNYNDCGDTVAAYSCYRPGNAVLVNLAPMAKGFRMILSQVEMMDTGLEYGAYRYSVQGWMKPQKPLNRFLKEYSYLGGTHHSAMVYDADIEEIKAFGRMMNFEVVMV